MPAWILNLHESNPVAHAIAVLSLVAVTGMALGSVKFRGVGLGVAGVLFSGILAGHFGQSIDHDVLEFTKEFGLILFIFTIGLQLGPGFFGACSQGLTLNLLALAIVLWAPHAAAMAAPVGRPFLVPPVCGRPPTRHHWPQASRPWRRCRHFRGSSGCGPRLRRGYPAYIAGIIGSMLLLKAIFRINPEREAQAARAAQKEPAAPLERRTLVIENPNLEGLSIADIPGRKETGVIVSRVHSTGTHEVVVATDATVVHRGDALLAVGPRGALDQFQRVIGRASDENLLEASGAITYRRILVTNRRVLGKTVPELGLDQRFSVVVSRITRADLAMTAVPDLRLKFGDVLQIVGPDESLKQAATFLGNSLRALNETHFVPLFAGILTGILIGMVPIAFPGLPTPIRLGLAGGPLIVALFVGRLGHLGPLVWHMPTNANLAFRELGIVLFLACVGLTAGTRCFEMAFSSVGALWLLSATCIAVVPLLTVGILARVWLKLDYTTLSGLLAGSMTDPPALAFANGIARSDAPSVAYATVYPLTMVLRIVVAQVLVLALLG
jgi:putative transport protein